MERVDAEESEEGWVRFSSIKNIYILTASRIKALRKARKG